MIEELLAAAAGGGAAKAEPETALPLEERVERLRALSLRYGTQPFKPGDLMTPREGTLLKGRGEPWIVLEVAEKPIYAFFADHPKAVDNHSFGARLDLRVAHVFDNGDLRMWWVESTSFEPWTPEMARRAEPTEAQASQPQTTAAAAE
jgi:hypothetical protein